ncbi:MAG: carotenoid oxygenase family protein [Acidimicrobiales bacterium]
MTESPYLHGNFAPVLEERSEDHELPVTGSIPPDLDGRLIRNGPNPAVVPPDESEYHWWAGDGMVHAISIGGERATGYRNRWVRTRALASRLGTPAPRGPSEPVDGPANANVIRHAGRTLALSESGFPLALSAGLDRARLHDFDGDLLSPMGAHPKIDPTSGELIFFGCDVFGPPFLRYHVADDRGALVRTETIDLPRAVMMHYFGVSATRAVLLDLPVLFDLDLAARGRSVPFRWMPDAGARVGVMPRDGDGDAVRWIGIDPVSVLHVLNCYDDDDDTVVLDTVRHDRAFDTEPAAGISSVVPVLSRWTIDVRHGRVIQQQLDDLPVEFPRVDPELAGLPHRYGYCAALSDVPARTTFGGLVKYDLLRDESTRFDPGPGRQASEPIFVRAADGKGDDEGWVLSIVHDPAREAGDLVILDATSFGGPPVATIHLPVRVPFGLHGSWVPADE